MSRWSSRGRAPLAVRRVALALLLVGLAGPLGAQPQRRPPAAAPDPAAEAAKQAAVVRAEMGKLYSQGVSKMLLSGQVTDRAAFDAYHTKRLELLKHPGNLAELPRDRDEMKRDLRMMGNAADKSAHAELNRFYLQRLQEVVWEQPLDRHHPVVRYNAMLMIGELNAQEPTRGGQGPVVPLAEALPVLLKGLSDAQTIDAVKVAALVGILRHAELGIADKQVEKRIVEELLKHVAEAQPPANRSEAAHMYMRRRMIDILGAVRRPGIEAGGKEAVAMLSKLLADRKNPLPMRADAARALGRFSLTPAEAALLPELAVLAVDITEQEPSRVGMRHYLLCVETALKGPLPVTNTPSSNTPPPEPSKFGVLAALPAAKKEQGDKLTEQVAALTKLLDIKPLDLVMLMQRVKRDGGELERWISETWPEAAAKRAAGQEEPSGDKPAVEQSDS